jgi:predicted TIM-barrel fold metal-dependent hydrolase
MPLDLSEIPIIDHHAHALLRRPPATAEEWLRCFTESQDPALIAGHAAQTLFFRYAVKALAGLLGCEPIPEFVLAARDRLSGADAAGDGSAWVRLLIRDAHIDSMLIDYGFRSSQNFEPEEMRALLPCRVEPILRLERLAEELIMRFETADQVLDAYVAEVEGARAAGYVALKSIIAYRTGLTVREWARGEVEAAFRPLLEQARREGAVRLASRPVNDTLLILALEIAQRQELPLQFHTGYGDADVDLLAANPLHFRPLLQSHRFSRVPWVILHMGYPYVRESAYLASIYANVYVDLSLAIPFAVGEAPALLTQLFGLAPTSKLMYASDGFSVPELFWLGARSGRAALGRALDEQIAGGTLSAREADEVAWQILSGNARSVYRL